MIHSCLVCVCVCVCFFCSHTFLRQQRFVPAVGMVPVPLRKLSAVPIASLSLLDLCSVIHCCIIWKKSSGENQKGFHCILSEVHSWIHVVAFLSLSICRSWVIAAGVTLSSAADGRICIGSGKKRQSVLTNQATVMFCPRCSGIAQLHDGWVLS